MSQRHLSRYGADVEAPAWHTRFLVAALLLSLSLSLLALQTCSAYVRRVRKTNARRRQSLLRRLGLTVHDPWTIIGFFHPYCDAGGGGERVLFEALRYHLQENPKAICVVYSGDATISQSLLPGRSGGPTKAAALSGSSSLADGGGTATKEEMLRKARDRFDIDLVSDEGRIAFLPLKSRGLVADKYWRRLTMLGQSFGGAILACEACAELIPEVFIDTMGYAFAFPVVRLFKYDCPIGAYVHYPTISTDMLTRVKSRQAGHTNDQAVAASLVRSKAKIIYYRIFAMLYVWALKRADVITANGTWTSNHLNHFLLPGRAFDVQGRVLVDEKLKTSDRVRKSQIVYPPCDTKSFESFGLDGRQHNTIVSLAQFRPEKEHAKQLRFLRTLLDQRPDLAGAASPSPLRLVMMGSCRNPGDEERIKQLRALATELNIEQYVEFVVNAPYAEVLERLSKASIGLSTMVDEHFGINVVEFMAAGLITLSHASAGPLLDIAVPVQDIDGRKQPTGFHAIDVNDFAAKAAMILSLPREELTAIRSRARRHAQQTFSTAAFRTSWALHLWQPLEERLHRTRPLVNNRDQSAGSSSSSSSSSSSAAAALRKRQ